MKPCRCCTVLYHGSISTIADESTDGASDTGTEDTEAGRAGVKSMIQMLANKAGIRIDFEDSESSEGDDVTSEEEGGEGEGEDKGEGNGVEGPGDLPTGSRRQEVTSQDVVLNDEAVPRTMVGRSSVAVISDNGRSEDETENERGSLQRPDGSCDGHSSEVREAESHGSADPDASEAPPDGVCPGGHCSPSLPDIATLPQMTAELGEESIARDKDSPTTLSQGEAGLTGKSSPGPNQGGMKKKFPGLVNLLTSVVGAKVPGIADEEDGASAAASGHSETVSCCVVDLCTPAH